jgi:O-antigen/teichoic acid export membrane protein
VIGRRSLLILIGRAATALLGYVGLYFMITYPTEGTYGSIAFTMALLASFNSLSDLGFSSAHVKKVSEGGDIDDCLSTFAVIKLLLNGAMIVISLVAIYIWSNLGHPLTAGTWSLLLLFLLYYVMYNVASVVTAHYSATMEQAKGQLVMLFDPLVRIPLIIFIVLGGGGAMEIAYAYVASALSIMIFALFFIYRDRVHWKRPTLYRAYFKFAAPLMLVGIIATLAGTMDKVMLGLGGDLKALHAVELFSSSQVVLAVLAIISASVATMTFPSFSKLHSQRNIKEICKLTYQAERYISILAMPIITVIVIFPTEAAKVLLTGTFADAGEPMRFLAIATLLGMLNSVHSSQILAVNRPDTSAKLTLLNFLVYGGLLLILVPANLVGIQMLGMSYTGAAIANLIAVVVLVVITRYTVYKLTGTSANPRLSLHVVAAGASAIWLTFLSDFVAISGWPTLVLYGITSSLVFAVVLYALRELKREDIYYFLDLLSVRKMFSYISKELGHKE